MSQFLENNEFKQLVKDATHIKGRHIDHFYLKMSGQQIEEPTIMTYSPYYSDHDAICATFPRNLKTSERQYQVIIHCLEYFKIIIYLFQDLGSDKN